MTALDDIFGPRAHDPGGKVRIRIADDMQGGATISECGRYRPLLWRRWGDEQASCMLWIGMNPSTADASVNDPTIQREVAFTKREGFTRYVKCNVMDYRATDQRELRRPDINPCSDDNLPTIQHMAQDAGMVVLCFGTLHKRTQPYGDAVVMLLQSMGLRPVCLGKNVAGSPKHPLYLAASTKFEPF